jgi:hypothetical protein
MLKTLFVAIIAIVLFKIAAKIVSKAVKVIFVLIAVYIIFTHVLGLELKLPIGF